MTTTRKRVSRWQVKMACTVCKWTGRREIGDHGKNPTRPCPKCGAATERVYAPT